MKVLALGAEQPEFLVEDLGLVDVRTHFEDETGEKTAEVPPPEALAATPLPELLEPLTLDPPTVPDDDTFVGLLGKERNVPKFVKDALRDLF
jgi:hypothetical protein